ncbi:hypothetical protein QRX60_30120 [Amycolatopsis mongoliensis]|uniref:Uncharacterized protein n=1 Tax=Amycolatopsis mongoliensis TaxID=715475 RepID=A0A9Y2JJ92_9PSEU|nr:hypothetical protein [Amycolatopsis sp. 4-36]WIX98313.1 hypothetical protein QRX60_30120 [Amycolatopsis sp. 4-36]
MSGPSSPRGDGRRVGEPGVFTGCPGGRRGRHDVGAVIDRFVTNSPLMFLQIEFRQSCVVRRFDRALRARPAEESVLAVTEPSLLRPIEKYSPGC